MDANKEPKFIMKGTPTHFMLDNPKVKGDSRMLAQQMPGQCGVLVVYNLVNKKEDDFPGYFKRIQLIAEHDGYPWLMASTVAQQEEANKALVADGWEKFWEFVNCRTENTVYMWRKALPNARPLQHLEFDFA